MVDRSRRRLLGASGAAAVSALAGCGALRDVDRLLGGGSRGTPTETPRPGATGTPSSDAVVRRGVEFDAAVDAVGDLGMDPTGETPVDGALDDAYGAGTVVEFPPGEYLVTETHTWDEGTSRFGLVGTGDSHTDAKFVFPPGNGGEPFRLFEVPSGSHHVLANLSIDQTMDDVTGADVWIANDDGALIEDVEWLGRTPGDAHARNQHLTFDCTSVEGVNVARRVYMRQSAVVPGYPDGVAGIRVGTGHVGEVRMEDCHIEQRGSSSFRATHPEGVVRVSGGLFKNNDNTNMRIGAGNHPTKKSWIRGARVVVDVDDLNEFAGPDDRIRSPEGLRIDATGHGYSNLLVEDCEFVYRSAPEDTPGIVTAPTWGGHGGFTVRDCRIHNETNVQTVHVSRTDTAVARRPWSARFEAVTISGSVESQPLGVAVYVGEDRPGSAIVDCCIDLPGGRFDGVEFVDSSGCAVVDTNINVAGDPIVAEDAEVETTDVTFGESCGS